MSARIESLQNIGSHVELDQVVAQYLAGIGELANSANESYEETADRLGDAFMRSAGEIWWELA